MSRSHGAPTMRDVALEVGVSKQTVSAVINGAPGITEETRRRVLSAFDVGANHRRDRWWLLGRRIDAKPLQFAFDDRKTTPSPNVDDLFGVVPAWVDGTWELGIPRLTDQKEYRADRLRMLGNSVVPQCAREAFLRLSGLGGICGFDR